MLRDRTRRDGVALAALAIVAALVRWPGFAGRPYHVFDEVYYVDDALRYLGWLDGGEVSWVHPPLGKWFIAAGIAMGGDDPTGWRVAVFLAGVATVVLTFLVGRTLLGSLGGALAGLFVAFDGLSIVQSRTGMLDAFLPPLVLGAALALVGPLAASPDPDTGDGPPLPTVRLLTAGVLLGAAVAVKWSAAPVLLAALVASAVRLRPRRPADIGRVVVALVVVPVAVYLVSWVRYWVDSGADVGYFRTLHEAMLDYHQTLTATHPGGSRAPSWLVMEQPVLYVYEADGDRIRQVSALGNPALWWGFLLAAPWILVRWWRDRHPVAEVVVFAYAALYLPWVVTFREGFLFYMTPVVPFTAIGLAWAVLQLWRADRPWRWVGRAVPALVVAVGLLYLPLWMGITVSRGYRDALLFLGSWD